MLSNNIDLGNPVADVPLNRGLVGWWLGLPNAANGSAVPDLTRHMPAGTLTGTAGSVPTWRPVDRVRRLQNFDGGANWVDYGTATACNFTTEDFSVIVDILFLSGTGDDVISRGKFGGSGWYTQTVSGGGGINVGAYVGSNTSVTCTAPSTLVGRLWRFGFSRSGAVISPYYDGRPVTGGSWGGSGNPNTSSEHLYTNNSTEHSRRMTGAAGNVRIYNRALTAAEFRAEYIETVNQYPTMLRRWSRKTWVMGGEAATTARSGDLLLLGVGA